MLKLDQNEWLSMLGGDEETFLLLYNKYYRTLFQYAFTLTADKELAKDCLQELFLEIWHSRSSLNKNVLHVKSYLFTWLRRKISHKRSIRIREKLSENIKGMSETEEFSYENLLIAFQVSEEKKRKLSAALDRLTKKQLEIIRLKFFYNLSYEEIASKTSLTTRTVYNTIYEALRHLREDVGLLV